MTLLLADVATLSLQIGIIVALGGPVSTWSRGLPPRVRFSALRLLLALCLALPLLAPRVPANVLPDVSISFALAPAGVPGTAVSTPVDWRHTASVVVLSVLGLGIFVRWSLIGLALWRLRVCASLGTSTTAGSDMQETLGTSADVRYVDGIGHPVTFGFWRPRVLLPVALTRHPEDIRRAVVCHELLHVRRRDWAWLVAEEMLRGVFWFHPAIQWLISRVQSAREELVDALVVATTGHRRAYMEALLAFSTAEARNPAPAFSPRHQLVRRLELIAKEASMSPIRIALVCVTIAGVVASGSWYAVHAFPLQASASGSAGPVERAAQPIAPDNPIPRRVVNVAPQYPDALRADKVSLLITLNVTVDASGRVAEHRVMSTEFGGADASWKTRRAEYLTTFEMAVADALRQWQYDPPATPPIAFPVSFWFMSSGAVIEFTTAAAEPATPVWHGGAIRVGNGVQPPEKVADVRPVYPAEAQEAGTSGVVILEIRIEPDGRVSHSRVMRSIPALDQAAINAVTQWQFRPALMNGAPTAVVMLVTVNFTLR